MFSYLCLFIAGLLAVSSKQEYKIITNIVFLEFLLCRLSAIIGLNVFSFLDTWGIYASYALIQVFTMLCFYQALLKGYKINWLIVALMGMAAIFNIIMARAYFGYAFYYSPKEMYNIYPNLLGFIMIFQLLYMSLFNKVLIKRMDRHGKSYSRFVDMVFMVSRGNINRRMA